MPTNPMIIDGHNDTLLALFYPKAGKERSFFKASDMGHIDLPRANAGGLGGGFFAVFVPNPPREDDPEQESPFPGEDMDDDDLRYEMPLPPELEPGYALRFAIGMVQTLYKLEVEAKGAARIVHNVADIRQCLQEGSLAMILHFEGAEPIDPDLHALHVFHAAGLRSLGIVWSRPNRYAHGVPFSFPASPDTGPGLTDAGKRLVRTCNELGILVDLSHLNEKGFWDVAKISSAPLVATHSGVHALCKTPRNLTDDQLDAIAESGGLVGVNFHTGFLRSDGRADKETSLSEIVRHVAYIADRCGIEHVALGSDFDGAYMPDDLKDAAGLPRLLAALRKYGFDDASVAKIAQENWLRVLEATWRSPR